LPWDQDGVICNDEHDCFIPVTMAEIGNAETLAEQLLETSGHETLSKVTKSEKIIDAEITTDNDTQRVRKTN
jgi:hypothetical protein